MKEETTKPLSPDRIPLVIEQMAFAKKLAQAFYRQRKNLDTDLEDYEGAALLGLCDAARRFDTSKGMNFQTYAYFRIRGAMYDLLRRGGGVPRRFFHAMIETQKHNGDEESSPSPAGQAPTESKRERTLPYAFARTAAELVGLTEIIQALGMRLHPGSDHDAVELTYAPDLTPESHAMLRNTRDYLERLIKTLTPDEQIIVQLRYFAGHTLEEVREKFPGASKSWISRIHVRALDALRNQIIADNSRCLKKLEKQEMRD